MPPVAALMRWAPSSATPRSASLTAAVIMSCSISTSLGVHRLGVDGQADQAVVALGDRLDAMPAAGGGPRRSCRPPLPARGQARPASSEPVSS